MAGVEDIETLDLEQLPALLAKNHGSPPPLRSVPILRVLLAWRVQTDARGGLDRETRRALARKGRILVRWWKGQEVEVVVETDGFCWKGDLFASLSAAAKAIAGTRWNCPRFFEARP